MQSRNLPVMLLLCAMTFAAQLFSLAYGRIDPQQSFVDILLPSVVFCPCLPYLVAGLRRCRLKAGIGGARAEQHCSQASRCMGKVCGLEFDG